MRWRRARVFISYRRGGGALLARLVRESLQQRGYDVFLDVEELRSGPFNTALLSEVDRCTDFVVILTSKSLDRCFQEDDWLRREVGHALERKKNVVALMERGFAWPPRPLPADIVRLRTARRVEVSHQFPQASLNDLVEKFRGRRALALLWLAALASLAAVIAAAGVFLGGRLGLFGPWGRILAGATQKGAPEPERPRDTSKPKQEQERLPPGVQWSFGTAEAKRRQEEAARDLRVPVEKSLDLGDGVQLALVLIPAGRFQMGSPPGEQGRDADEAQRLATVRTPFWIGKHEVTQEQWQTVMGGNPSLTKGPKLPVGNVAWTMCQEFVKRLNAQVGGGRFELPTEEQWEWACRAGSNARFCFGEDEKELGEYAWHEGNSGKGVLPVGMRKPNSWGLCDMHGNVCEWTSTPYAGGSIGPTKAGALSAASFVLRGGSYLDLASLRCAKRFRQTREARLGENGCRVALRAQP